LDVGFFGAPNVSFKLSRGLLLAVFGVMLSWGLATAPTVTLLVLVGERSKGVDCEGAPGSCDSEGPVVVGGPGADPVPEATV
jgi:hypothetical protein